METTSQKEYMENVNKITQKKVVSLKGLDGSNATGQTVAERRLSLIFKFLYFLEKDTRLKNIVGFIDNKYGFKYKEDLKNLVFIHGNGHASLVVKKSEEKYLIFDSIYSKGKKLKESEARIEEIKSNLKIKSSAKISCNEAPTQKSSRGCFEQVLRLLPEFRYNRINSIGDILALKEPVFFNELEEVEQPILSVAEEKVELPILAAAEKYNTEISSNLAQNTKKILNTQYALFNKIFTPYLSKLNSSLTIKQ